MATPAKITLSPQELQLVTNSEWILTKRVITDKVYLLLGALSEQMKGLIENEKEWLPRVVIDSEPKIYRGENYRQLPYVLLDHPRCFSTTGILAIRTMFWWGNFFSITIHLSGQYKKMFEGSVNKNMTALNKQKYYICINEDQWQHHFEPGNYVEVSTLETGELKHIIDEQQFIKLALQFSLHQWDEISLLLERSFFEMLQLLKP